MATLRHQFEANPSVVGINALVAVNTELEGEDIETFDMVESEFVTDLNFGGIFFGQGTVRMRVRKRRS